MTANQENALVFEGMVSLRALIAGRKRKIEKVLYAESRKEKNVKEYAFLRHRAEEGLFELVLCPKEEIDGIAPSRTHGGVIALCKERVYPSLPGKLPENGFYVMTEGIEDPFNFGYALRSLYAAGADGVILASGVRTGADGTVCRSSAGASERMEICLSKPEDAVSFFRSQGYKIVCADLPDSVPVYDADLKKPLLLIVGGEKRGISRPVLDACDATVRLEYGREFDAALSAASAASILAFEVYRQNR
ncbi:MAG: RNA methyltransferase [Clostridia bacterium]|nr:RNA methyltransferase [Clostridia bacterium]